MAREGPRAWDRSGESQCHARVPRACPSSVLPTTGPAAGGPIDWPPGRCRQTQWPIPGCLLVELVPKARARLLVSSRSLCSFRMAAAGHSMGFRFGWPALVATRHRRLERPDFLAIRESSGHAFHRPFIPARSSSLAGSLALRGGKPFIPKRVSFQPPCSGCQLAPTGLIPLSGRCYFQRAL